MPTYELEVNGRRFQVDAPSPDHLALVAKSIAGDMQPQPAAPAPSKTIGDVSPDSPWYQKFAGAADDVARIGANALTFGAADRIAGALGGEGFDAEKAKTQAAKERAGWAGTVADVGSSLASGAGLAKAGVTAGRLIPEALSTGLPGAIARGAASVADGTMLGAADAALHGDDAAKGAAYGAVAGAGGHALGSALSGLGEKIGAAFNRPGPIPSAESIKDIGEAAYKRAKGAGVIIGSPVMKNLADDVQGALTDFGFHPELQPRIATAFGELQRLSDQNVTATGLDTARKIVSAAAQSQDPSERKLGRMMIEKIDDTLANLKPADVIAGDPKVAADAFAEARDAWRRKSKLEDVEQATERATNNAASQGSGGNIDNATRQQFRSILNDPKKWRGYSDDELAAMKLIVRGTPVQDAMRLVGKLSPEGNGLMTVLQALGASATGGATLPMAGAGFVAKRFADAATPSNVDELRRIIAAGGKREAAFPPDNALQRLSKSERDALIKGLTASGLALSIQ